MIFTYDIMMLPFALVLTIALEVSGVLKPDAPVSAETASISLQAEALASTASQSTGVVVRGADARMIDRLHFERSDLKDKAVSDLARKDSVLINRQAADQLKLRRGELVTIVLPAATQTPMGPTPKSKSYRVAAVVVAQDDADMIAPVVYLDGSEARDFIGVDQQKP